MVALNKSQQALFSLGRVLMTPGAIDALVSTGSDARVLLVRHQTGDFGDISNEDKKLNDAAVKDGTRIFSAYNVSDDVKMWIITEAAGDDGKRACTTFLLPDEY